MGYHPSSVRKVARRCMAALTYQMVTRGFSKEESRDPRTDVQESERLGAR